MEVQQICNTCEKTFTPLDSSKGLFCTKECYWNSKKRKTDYVCNQCGNQTSPVKGVELCQPCEVKRRKGEKHPMWKGALVSYRSLHKWVERELGKPTSCESCSKFGEGHNMHWANISGEYKREVSDWMRLCPQCHKDFDLQKSTFNKNHV